MPLKNFIIKAHKENAPECLGMVHYTELMEDKGIVLMVGEYDKDTLVSFTLGQVKQDVFFPNAQVRIHSSTEV